MRGWRRRAGGSGGQGRSRAPLARAAGSGRSRGCRHDHQGRHHRGTRAVAPAVGNDRAAERGAGEAAKAPEAVERRHDRPAAGEFGCRRLGVDGDVVAAGGQAEDRAGDEQHQRAEGADRQRRQDGEHRQERGRCGSRADSPDQPGGERLGNDGTKADAEQGEAENGGIEAEADGDDRDVDRPQRQAYPAQEKSRRRRQSAPAERPPCRAQNRRLPAFKPPLPAGSVLTLPGTRQYITIPPVQPPRAWTAHEAASLGQNNRGGG